MVERLKGGTKSQRGESPRASSTTEGRRDGGRRDGRERRGEEEERKEKEEEEKEKVEEFCSTAQLLNCSVAQLLRRQLRLSAGVPGGVLNLKYKNTNKNKNN